jgi:hypothetical protein
MLSCPHAHYCAPRCGAALHCMAAQHTRVVRFTTRQVARTKAAVLYSNATHAPAASWPWWSTSGTPQPHDHLVIHSHYAQQTRHGGQHGCEYHSTAVAGVTRPPSLSRMRFDQLVNMHSTLNHTPALYATEATTASATNAQPPGATPTRNGWPIGRTPTCCPPTLPPCPPMWWQNTLSLPLPRETGASRWQAAGSLIARAVLTTSSGGGSDGSDAMPRQLPSSFSRAACHVGALTRARQPPLEGYGGPV